MVIAQDIQVRLGRVPVLHGVGFSAAPGQVTAIVGPNGSGKTTLLRALTGEVPYGGTVTLNGRVVAQMAPWELAAIRAVLPQAAALAFPFTVLEVVRLGLTAGVSAQRAALPHEALARVGLAGFDGRMYQELSGGEKQRVQLARVLTQIWEPVAHGAPRWLFLDEPVSSLDIGHQLGVMQLVRDYAEAGGGVIAVMHDLNLTAMFADRVALVCGGRIRAQGPVDEVLTDAHLSAAYGCALRINTAPPGGATYVLPHSASAPVPGKLAAE
ncbi:heme ABC transporter ATP-binding protein [Actibacterium sp. D379-3]